MRSIAGTGLLALDVLIADPGTESASTYAGGTCGNVLSILGYFGWRATPIATVGDDSAGKRLLADLRQWSVSLDRVVVDSASRTPVFVQTLHKDPQGRPRHSFNTACPLCGGALYASSAVEVAPAEFLRSDAPDFFFMDRLSPSILVMAESARRLGATVVYEPSVESDRHFWSEALTLVDVLKYSDDRFQPFDFDAHRVNGRAFWEVQTLGARGLRFCRNAREGKAEWIALDAVSAPKLVDTCGAGDWCTAGLLVAAAEPSVDGGGVLASTETFGRALRNGQAYAAWACGFEGARGAMYANEAGETHRAAAALLLGASPDSLPYAYPRNCGTSSICDAAHGPSAHK